MLRELPKGKARSNMFLRYEIVNYDCMDAEGRAKQDARAENN